MYAQVLASVSAPDRLEELDRVIRDELVPALRTEPGFSGALSLVERETARALVFVFWETEAEAARPLIPCDAPFLQALTAIAAFADPSPCTVWEVAARG